MNILKELRTSILVLVLYGICCGWLKAGSYLTLQAQRTYEFKYSFLSFGLQGIFWLFMGICIAYLGGIPKKSFLWLEILIIDIPAAVLLISGPLYFATNLSVFRPLWAYYNSTMPLGAALLGCEIVRYVRYFKCGRSPYKRIV